jgi:hypothetical protein
MKRDIFLKTEYRGGPKSRAAAFKQFRDGIKELSFITILKEIEPHSEVIIEFPDDKYKEVYEFLRTLDIVELIDSILPPSEA